MSSTRQKAELKLKLVSLLVIAIMLCAIFPGAVTAENKKRESLSDPPPNTGNTGYEPWYYYAGGIVNTANGNLYLAEKDISIKARGFDIEIIRSYNSHNSGKYGPFGFGWTFNYNIYLKIKNKDGSVTYWDGDGSAHTFTPAGGGKYDAPPGMHSRLTEKPDGSFTLWFTDGSKYNFGSNGRINNITDKNNNHLNFEYNLLGRLTRISDDSGLYLDIDYNLQGRISSIVDPLGREIRYEYNVNDLTKVTDAMGHSLLYFYYDNHKIRSMVDEMDNTLLFSYGTISGVDRVSEIKGTVYDRQTRLYSNPITFYSFEYDTINKLVEVIDSNGRTISVRYNEAGNPIKITDLLGNTISINWKNHTQIGITDKNENTFLYEYDAYGNLIDSTGPMGYSRYYRWTTINTDDKYLSLLSNITNKKGYTTEYEYDRQGNLILVTDAHGNATTRAYDAFGYVTLLTERGGTQTVYFHDSHGNLINAADSTGSGTKFSYDPAGRLLSITDANNHSIEYEYNSNNNLIRMVENDQIETEYDYDALGKLVRVNDANGMQTEYKRYRGKTEIIEPLNTRTTHYYDHNGNIVKITNARGYNTSLEYDALGRVIAAYDNHGNIERFSYDALGNLIGYTDMNNRITTYAYDSLSRLIHVKYPSSDNIFYNWTETGKILSMQNRDSKITYQYDALDRLVSVLFDYGTFNRTISYHYGADDNPIAMMDPDGNITRYEYDELNRLVRIVDPSAGDIAFEYDEGSRRTVISYPNNARISYTYDRTDRISNILNLKSNGEVISNYSYTYDALGNRLSVNESGDITSYGYDALCRLIQVTYPNADVVRYTYDKNGNRLTMVNGTTSISYTYDADDRLLSDGTADYSYDANGNLIRKTDGSDITTYVYGDENRLIKAVLPDGMDVAYRYFPNGFRMSKTVDSNTTYYFYDREDILMELDANGIQLARYTHGQGIDDPLAIVKGGVRGYYLRDALGSVTSIIDANENLLAEYQYDAYGVIKKITENLENPYTFTGREYDVETGLYYYRARYYSPEIGRFTTRDPIPTLESSPYVYVENNPVNYIDPSGKVAFVSLCFAVAVVGGSVVYLLYKAVSGVNTYLEAFEQAIQSGKRRRELLNRLAKGDITPDNLEKLHRLVQGNLQNAAAAAWALYSSIPGTLQTGSVLTSGAAVTACAGGSLLTSFLSDGYVPDIEEIEKEIDKLTDDQRKQFDQLQEALESGDKEEIVNEIITIYRRRNHPDDNYDVSIFSYSPSKTGTSETGTFNYKSEEIAILANGFYEEFSDLLTELGESATFVDVYTPLDELKAYQILIIPSAGFSGISSLSSFKSKLENYVNDGGTLIVYSQNHGYEFNAVPGDLSGYGWTEDQACHYRSVAINTYHPILSGQDSVTLDVVVDGFFATYPENATILLTRTKNGMPAMLMYEYGNGTVIATTIYTDWAYGHHQATRDGKRLVRDMISWSNERKEMPDYGSGDSIDIPINVTSYIDLTSDKVKFEVIADNEVIDTVEVTISVPPYETKTVDFTYTAPSKFGILHIDYLLVNNSYGEVQRVHDAQQFEVSKYVENPDGFVYRGKELQIWATSSDDYVAKGSEVVFSVYVRNNGDDSLNGNIGIYGHEAGGAWWAYYDNIPNITIPPHSEDDFTYIHKMEHSTAVYFGLFDKPVDYKRINMEKFSRDTVASCQRGVWTFSPSVDIGIETEKEEYTIGEEVCILLNLTNNQKVRHNVTVTARTLDPANKMIYEDSFDANLSAYESTNKTLSFSLPNDSRHGTCIVTAEAFENEEKIGSNSIYFELPKTYRIRVDYDKPNKVYGIRQNLSLTLNITNTGSSVWTSWVNTSIPSLSFSDSKYVSLNPNESREIEYKDFSISTDFNPGKYDVFVNLSYDSTTTKDNFFIPCSNLRIEAGKKNNAGENFSFTISNVGGVDTDFNCSFKFHDWKRGKMIYEGVVEDTVISLNSRTISFEIPNQSVNGLYYLLVSCRDIKTGKETELAAKCEASGLKADLTSDTERRVYFKNENVSILTTITNQNGEIVNGTLNLKIVRAYTPNSTRQALARAAAKLSASPNDFHNSLTQPSPSPASLKFSPSTPNLQNLIATTRAAPLPSNSTPSNESLPEHEEPASSPPLNLTPSPSPSSSPFPSPSPTPSLTPSPTPTPTTPTPEPEEERELNETYNYKPSAAKLSSLEIGNETVWKDEVKILNENFIVNSTGKLTLINTTVIMNCSSDGQYHIEVQNGGELHIFDSEITASDSMFEYYFQVKSGAKFEMRDSELHECGYTWGTNEDHAGLWINTNDTIIENNLITNNYCGIALYRCNNNTIENNTINSNSIGIYLRGSCKNNAIGNNTIESNGDGISFNDASNNNIIENNVIKNNNYDGIELRKSHNNRIISNNLTSNRRYGITLYGSGSNTIKGNNVEKSKENGIALSTSWSNKIISNWITSNNGRGIHIEGSDNNNVTGNNVSFNSYYGIEFSGNNHVLADNIVNSNGWSGIRLTASNSILRNNTINSNSGWGIYMHAASYNRMFNNRINDNNRNFGVETSHHDWDKHFNHSIDTSNTVNGKPIYYIVNEKDKIYDETTNAGYFAAVFCENITIKNLNNLTNNSEAVLFRKTHHSHIENISGMFNTYGINLMHSDNNSVSNSNLSANSHGLYMWYSSGDGIRNCNISSNDKHGVYIYPSSNNNQINNCIISSNKEHGVYINDHSDSNDILNNSITSNGRSGITIDGWTYNCELNNNSISLNNDYGIYIPAGGSNKIFNNTVTSKKEGIYIPVGGSNKIFNNTVTSKEGGIYFRDGTNNILRNNTVTSDSYPLHFSNADSVAQDIDTTNTLNGFKAITLSGVNNVTVTNFSIVMPEKIKVTNRGIINLANCKNISIENITIVNHSAHGIFVYKSSDNIVANCTLNSNNIGVYVYGSRVWGEFEGEHNDILNNTLNNNRIGAFLRGMYYYTVRGNEMNSNSEHGIYITGCCGNSGESVISDNTINLNGKRGIYIGRTGGNVLINNNTLNSNKEFGIYVDQTVYEATNFHVSNNTITNNEDKGIYFESTKNNNFSITSNIIKANHYGLYVKGHSDANLIYDNFFENTINAYANEQNTWNITKTFADDGNIIGGPWLGGNYWSDYEGEDEDGDKLGDTLLPYNCSGRIKEGGDYLPLVMPRQPGEVLWEKNITINLVEGETKNIVSEVPASVFKDVTGKQKLSTTFYSETTQIINISDSFFYITPKNTSLTMETDKRVYKPNETVLIYGEVKNHASAPADCNLSIKKGEAEIFNDSFTLATDETRYYRTNTCADASFTLEGTVDGVVVLDSLSVESPEINASIIAPDVVGIKDFDVGVLIQNIGNISASLNVSMDGKRWNITVPAGESQLLETYVNTTKNMTITVIISGDVNETIRKELMCGENAKITITPEPTYVEGTVEIPFVITNTGVLDSEFNATFSISSTDNKNSTKSFFVPKCENISDSISFNLTKGAHLLRYTSPFEVVTTTISVLSPPEFVVASIQPAELNFTIGEDVTLVFEVKNIGGSEGEASLKLSITDFEDTNRTWIRAGAGEHISFNFTIPDDLEEKSYKGSYELDGKRGEFTYSVRGANISVNASLDKNMYEQGDTAIFTLEIANDCVLDLSLYSRVKFNEYDSIQNVTLPAGSGSKTLTFNVPVQFTGDNKMLYTVYMDSGRALYINSIYIYEKKPEAVINVYTDKDVYAMGEDVTIHIKVAKTDLLNLTAPGFTYRDTISGPTTLKFTLPELRSGTYYSDYRFGNFSSSHPFDVIGYSARILEARLDKEKYYNGDTIRLDIHIEANRNVSGLLRTCIYNPEDELIDEFEMNETLVKGENEMEISRTLLTNISGMHVIVYGFYADLSDHRLIPLASGAEYFDAEESMVQITVYKGWNMISLPFQPLNISASSVLLTIPDTAGDLLYTWSANTNAYEPVYGLMELELGRAYLIPIASNGIWIPEGIEVHGVEVSLAAGWNMIGLPSATNTSATAIRVTVGEDTYNLVDAIQNGYISGIVYSLNAATEKWDAMEITSPDAVLKPGIGYFAHVNQECTITYP